VSALEEIEVDWSEGTEIRSFLGRRGNLAFALSWHTLETNGYGMPAARWNTKRTVAHVPEVCANVYRAWKRTEFRSTSKRTAEHLSTEWRDRARSVLRACLRGGAAAEELAAAVDAASRLGDPSAFLADANRILRSRRHRS
jgi:hypothetical protein